MTEYCGYLLVLSFIVVEFYQCYEGKHSESAFLAFGHCGVIYALRFWYMLVLALK